MRGQAVHARGGRRADYLPVNSRLAPGKPGDASAVAAAYRHQIGAGTLYVADLDAIQGGKPQRALVTKLVGEFGGAVWVDAGLQHVSNEVEFRAAGIARVVLGLESLGSMAQLRGALVALGPDRVTLSLDLRGGQPIVQPLFAAELGGAPTAVDIARRATEYGLDHLLVLDLARVGRDMGVDPRMVAAVRSVTPGATLIAGGGVRSWSDLETLADAGADAVLVASALHDGRIGAREAALLGERA